MEMSFFEFLVLENVQIDMNINFIAQIEKINKSYNIQNLQDQVSRSHNMGQCEKYEREIKT